MVVGGWRRGGYELDDADDFMGLLSCGKREWHNDDDDDKMVIDDDDDGNDDDGNEFRYHQNLKKKKKKKKHFLECHVNK